MSKKDRILSISVFAQKKHSPVYYVQHKATSYIAIALPVVHMLYHGTRLKYNNNKFIQLGLFHHIQPLSALAWRV